jgi:hypothetical protein
LTKEEEKLRKQQIYKGISSFQRVGAESKKDTTEKNMNPI